MYDIANLLVSQYRAIGWGILWCPHVMIVEGPILPFYKVHSYKFIHFYRVHSYKLLVKILGNLNLAVLDNTFVIYHDISPFHGPVQLICVKRHACLGYSTGNCQYYSLLVYLP